MNTNASSRIQPGDIIIHNNKQYIVGPGVGIGVNAESRPIAYFVVLYPTDITSVRTTDNTTAFFQSNEDDI